MVIPTPTQDLRSSITPRDGDGSRYLHRGHEPINDVDQAEDISLARPADVASPMPWLPPATRKGLLRIINQRRQRSELSSPCPLGIGLGMFFRNRHGDCGR